MSEHLGILDSATGDWDEGGFYLTLGTDEGGGHSEDHEPRDGTRSSWKALKGS